MAKNSTMKSLILLFIVIQIISMINAEFSPFSSGSEFSLSNDLVGIYNQVRSSSSGGYHQAKVAFKTTVPSINPDQTNVVTDIKCDSKAKTITLSLTDSASLDSVKTWPNRAILMVSDKWKCFEESTTQYYFIGNQTLNEQEKSVTFETEQCDIKNWSDNFSFDLQWIEGNKQSRKHKRRRSYNKRNFNKRASVDKELKLDLDFLFDEDTGKSTKPNFPILSLDQGNNVTAESLVCANCFVEGEATLFMHVSGRPFPPKIEQARFGFNGNIRLNVDLGFNGKLTAALTSPDLQIAELPLNPFSIPGVFQVGPSLILAVSSQISANVKGTVVTGGELSMPNFKAEINLDDINNPQLDKSGFDVQTKPHDSKLGVSVGAKISGSLKPQLALSLNVLNGLFGVKTGVNIVSTLSASVDFNTKFGCSENKSVHLATTLDGNFGFFVQSKNLPVINFPSTTLADACIPIN